MNQCAYSDKVGGRFKNKKDAFTKLLFQSKSKPE